MWNYFFGSRPFVAKRTLSIVRERVISRGLHTHDRYNPPSVRVAKNQGDYGLGISENSWEEGDYLTIELWETGRASIQVRDRTSGTVVDPLDIEIPNLQRMTNGEAADEIMAGLHGVILRLKKSGIYLYYHDNHMGR